MKHVVGISGYLLVAYVTTFVIRQCKSETMETGSLLDTNGTMNTNPENVNRDEDEDDFVPYQGERFSLFDWMLFKALSKKFTGNVLLSPISLKIALVLLYEGAQDKTAYELANVMQLPVTRTATRDRFFTILQSLQANSPAYTLNIGTRIYIDSNILIRQRYEAIMKIFYNTDVITGNLSDAQPLVQAINNWVCNITNNNIDRMIEDESSIQNSLMLIVNALFFKGSWRHKYFSPENTRISKFHVTDNRTVDVPFMHAFGRFYYSESSELDAKILRIPYDGHKFAMYLLLPRTWNGIEWLVNKVNPFILTRQVWLMQDLSVDVSIPKFKFEFSSHLETVLRELGIRDIFDDTATLTGIARTKRTSKHLKVSDILQKAGIEVNENGTTAYVATEIEIGNKIEDETFNANRPFLFYIEDESTGAIIYMGKMTNPLDATGGSVDTNQQLPSRFAPEIPEADSVYQAGLNTGDRDNIFNAYLSQTLNKQYKDGNLISSPVSVRTILTILMEGANSDTRSKITSVLRLPEDEFRKEKLMQHIFASLKNNKNGTETDLISRLWIDESLHVLDIYKDNLQSRYQVDIENVNFKESYSTVRRINEWVRRVSRNVNSSTLLLNDFPPDTRLIFTSVVYFKGDWLKSFDKACTTLQCFYVPNGKCRNVYFMKQESIYRYAYIPAIDAHILEIPYLDGKTSMLVLMPNSKEKDPYLQILSEDLITIPVSAMLANLKKRNFTIYLPKFNISSNLNLIPTLQHLGINSTFRLSINLTKTISSDVIHLTNILQNVGIEIDEGGTQTTTNTDIECKPSSSWSTDIKINRSFIFLIIDSVSSMILFSGRLIEPL